jgi:hypothetical protein
LKVGGIGKLKGRDGVIIASSGIGFSYHLSALVKILRRNRLSLFICHLIFVIARKSPDVHWALTDPLSCNDK